MKKIMIAALLIVAILVGGTGCMKQNNESFRELALCYMEEKYGEPFVFVSSWGSSYANKGIQEIVVHCESQSEDILVRGVKEGDAYTFSDSYLAVKYKEQMASAVKALSDEFFGESKVFYTVMKQALSPDLPANATFDEYSTDPGSGIVVYVAVPRRAFSGDQVQAFAEMFRKTGMTASVQLLVTDDDTYSGLDMEKFNTCITKSKYDYCAIIHISSTKIKIYPGEDGLNG